MLCLFKNFICPRQIVNFFRLLYLENGGGWEGGGELSETVNSGKIARCSELSLLNYKSYELEILPQSRSKDHCLPFHQLLPVGITVCMEMHCTRTVGAATIKFDGFVGLGPHIYCTYKAVNHITSWCWSNAN